MRARVLAFSIAALTAAPALADSIPTCKKPLASVIVLEPDLDWWSDLGLGSPRGLLEGIVDESGCFTRLTSAADTKDKADFALTPDVLKASPDRELGPARGGPATDGVGGGGADGGGLNSDGMNGSPSVIGKRVSTREVSVVELTLSDQKGGKRPVKTQAMAPSSAEKKTPISTPVFGSAGLQGYAESPLGRRVLSAYLVAYRDLIRTLERQAAKEATKKD